MSMITGWMKFVVFSVIVVTFIACDLSGVNLLQYGEVRIRRFHDLKQLLNLKCSY